MSSQQSSIRAEVIATVKTRETDGQSVGQPARDRELNRRRDLTFLYAALEHEAIVALAHRYWQERGCPEGSAEEDWFRAEQDIHAKTRFGCSVPDYYQCGPVLRMPH
jgi:hypothetical protein